MTEKKNFRLLVVEDNEFYRNLFIRHLKNEGYTDISEANDGEQALTMVQDESFDVILLDIEIAQNERLPGSGKT